MSVLFGYLSSESYRFVHNATETEGTVINLVVKSPAGSQRQPNPRARNIPVAPVVRYTVNGKSYTYVAAHGRYHERLKVGDPVTILYDPSNPAVARLRGEGKFLIPLITSGFVTAVLVLGGVLYLTRKGPLTQGPGLDGSRLGPVGGETVEPQEAENG
jgi:hypothetical protein